MTNWHYHDPAQGRVGPIDADTLRSHFRAGKISRATLVWREGLREWQTLERLSTELELDGELRSPVPPPLPAAPTPTHPAPSPASQPREQDVTAASTGSAGSARDDGYTSTAPAAHAERHPDRAPAPSHGDPASLRPADYAPAHVTRRQAAPPPKRGLSGCMIALIVLAALAIPVLGILAAIALPAYQDYTLRAKVASAVAESSVYKIQVAEHYLAHEGCPNNQSPGFQPAADYAGAFIASVEFGRSEDSGECRVQIELRGLRNAQLDGKKIWQSYEPSSQRWLCTSDIEKRALLPIDCRG